MKIRFSYKTRKNCIKLQTALCKNQGKLSGGGGKINGLAPKSVFW